MITSTKAPDKNPVPDGEVWILIHIDENGEMGVFLGPTEDDARMKMAIMLVDYWHESEYLTEEHGPPPAGANNLIDKYFDIMSGMEYYETHRWQMPSDDPIKWHPGGPRKTRFRIENDVMEWKVAATNYYSIANDTSNSNPTTSIPISFFIDNTTA